MTLKEFLHEHYSTPAENNPNIGCLVTLKNKKQYLIGHINSVGGVCDDCDADSQEAIQLHKKLMERTHEMELFAVRNKIDTQLQYTPHGTFVDSLKSVLDVLSKEYEALGWYCRQYTKDYFHIEANYLQISSTPFEKPWKERILNFLSKL